MRKPDAISFQRDGFSHIELLVFLAVIALVIAVLIPTISILKSRSTRSDCLSNLRQIGVAFSLYAQENGGSYPTTTCFNVMGKRGTSTRYDDPAGKENGMATGWEGEPNISYVRPLNKYLTKKEVCHCPADGGIPGQT